MTSVYFYSPTAAHESLDIDCDFLAHTEHALSGYALFSTSELITSDSSPYRLIGRDLFSDCRALTIEHLERLITKTRWLQDDSPISRQRTRRTITATIHALLAHLKAMYLDIEKRATLTVRELDTWWASEVVDAFLATQPAAMRYLYRHSNDIEMERDYNLKKLRDEIVAAFLAGPRTPSDLGSF